MPITSQVAVRARHDAQNPRQLLPRLDENGVPLVTPPDTAEEPSHPFVVQDQPAIVVAGSFEPNVEFVDEIAIEVSPDGGVTWQALWIHGRQAKLTVTNSVIYLPIPGIYRVHRIFTPGEFLGDTPVGMYYGTLSHEAAMALLPWNSRGADGIPGAAGTIPALRIHTYAYDDVITVETNLYDIADITMLGPMVLFFSGGQDGKACVVRIRQGVGSPHVLTYGAGIRMGTDLTPTVAALSTTPNALDYLMVRYCAADNTYDLLAINHGFI